MSDACPATVSGQTQTASPRRRALLAACGAHAVNDGLTDLIYVLLPIWQTQFGLSYAQIGLMRGAYSSTMAGFQLLASRAARRFGRRALLIGGTALVGMAYLLAGQAGGLAALLAALVLGGLGASTQHPLASSLVTDTHVPGRQVKQALSHYNFAGDIGKTLVPALVGVSLTVMSWRLSVTLAGVLGLLAALGMYLLIPRHIDPSATTAGKTGLGEGKGSPGGLRALLATGFLDSAVRMGFLTFLPFLISDKGAGTAGIGLALTLLFIGGAFGKLICGYLGARVGLLKTVWFSESLTAALIVAAVYLPLNALMILLPLLGLVLNGTSSVLYGVVPELAAPGQREQAFALFYTGTIGGGALAPIVFGRLGDLGGMPLALMVLAATLMLTLPLTWFVDRGLEA
ncbi:MFS transporter [Pseudomonas sp. GD04058]|uniref:MFS transporter n=1 Tax=Pseudomonas sp. GD04058 TaxID=2975429 RepID=UPI002446A03B|nr:MFS transporter [Pseudomonas sp. GD04058]MDG9882538.1 MFS transporter [Pseudomonas sp. GD04058]